jgi:hypothetical protein
MNQRTPPFDIGLMPEKIKNLNGWPVALTYVGEKRRNRLFLTDLSHVPKWAFHRKDMDGAQPFGLKMSRKPGQVRVEGDRLGVRLTPWNVSSWCCGVRLRFPRMSPTPT